MPPSRSKTSASMVMTDTQAPERYYGEFFQDFPKLYVELMLDHPLADPRTASQSVARPINLGQLDANFSAPDRADG